MKRIIMAIMIMLIVLMPLQSKAFIFSDMDNHWAEDHVFWATFDVPVFSGYPDGTYRPDQSISRAEFITMLVKILNESQQGLLPNQAVTLPYADLPVSHWAYGHVQFLYHYLQEAPQADLTLQQIFAGSLLRPGQPISRYEAALLTHSLTTPPLPSDPVPAPFSDIHPDDPHSQRLLELAQNQLFSGYEDGTFRSAHSLTRAEAAVMARKIHRDLNYLTPDRLGIGFPEQIDGYRYPTLDMPVLRAEFTPQDRRMDKVIATLEYIAIVGYIPFGERELYDPDPIGTLWELKNGGYPHVIAINYYLLVYDTQLQRERKVELATETLRTYLETQPRNLNGFMVFLHVVHPYASSSLLEEAVKAYRETGLSSEEEVDVVILLSLLKRQQGKNQEAIALYPPMIESATDIEQKLKLIQKETVLRFETYGVSNALSALDRHWNRLRGENRYWFYEETIREELTALSKQLLVRR